MPGGPFQTKLQQLTRNTRKQQPPNKQNKRHGNQYETRQLQSLWMRVLLYTIHHYLIHGSFPVTQHHSNQAALPGSPGSPDVLQLVLHMESLRVAGGSALFFFQIWWHFEDFGSCVVSTIYEILLQFLLLYSCHFMFYCSGAIFFFCKAAITSRWNAWKVGAGWTSCFPMKCGATKGSNESHKPIYAYIYRNTLVMKQVKLD